MPKVRYQPLGPLLSTEGSRAFLGLQISEDAPPLPVVLVWIPEEIAQDPEAAAKLRQETNRAASLDHPNIIRVHCLASLDEGMARVVEFADGETLRTILNLVKKLPPGLAALLIADACIGVHYAHLAGNEDGTPLVHGDLRPETLLVSFSGVCKVTGYGGLSVAPKELAGRRVFGRRQHCAPEQLLGGREAANRQTDVYLLGAALYECLTGKIPFEEEPDLDLGVLNKPLQLPPPEEVPADLTRVVEIAMAKRAAERYPTTRALRDAIEKAIGQFPAHEELSVFLKKFYPEDSPARAGRRRVIETGIAELSRQTPPAEAARPTQAPRRKRPPAESERIELQDPVLRPRRERSIAIYLVAAGVVIGGLGFWYAGRTPRKVKVPAEMAAAAQSTVASLPRSLKPDDRPRAGDNSTKRQEAAATIRPPTGEEGKTTSQAAVLKTSYKESTSQQPRLELTVDPPVDVAVDGRPIGHSPVKLAITPGKHAVQLTNQDKGISVSRSIRVNENGTTSLRMAVGKAVLAITAPKGATVYIDAKPVGTAPLKEISVFEGSHRISATVGGVKWRQSFKVEANQRMSFNIETKGR